MKVKTKKKPKTTITMAKEKKIKKEKEEEAAGDTSTVAEPSYDDKLKFTSVIAKPMASKKLTKKVTMLCYYILT